MTVCQNFLPKREQYYNDNFIETSVLECVFPWKPGLPKCFKFVAIPCLVVIVQTYLTVVSLFIRVLGVHRRPKLESPEEEWIILTCHSSFLLSPVAEQRFQLLFFNHTLFTHFIAAYQVE